MNVNPYFEQMVLGATPMELVRLLYQRAITLVREGREHLAAGRIEERVRCVGKAYDVVAELLGSLNREEAPELAQQLSALYCYVQQRLLDANLQKKDEPLAEVLGLLSTLAEAWKDAPAPQPVVTPQVWMTEGAESQRMAFAA